MWLAKLHGDNTIVAVGATYRICSELWEMQVGLIILLSNGLRGMLW